MQSNLPDLVDIYGNKTTRKEWFEGYNGRRIVKPFLPWHISDQPLASVISSAFISVRRSKAFLPYLSTNAVPMAVVPSRHHQLKQ
ncbi:hypothetical protein U1Q18_004393 [Sarracenia purpurea var. burkii]